MNIERAIYNQDWCGVFKYLGECDNSMIRLKPWNIQSLSYIFLLKQRALALIELAKMTTLHKSKEVSNDKT